MKRAIVILIFILSVSVGCQEQADRESPPQETAVITQPPLQNTAIAPDNDQIQTTVKMAVDNEERVFYQPLVAAFAEEHPEINVELLIIEDLGANADDYWNYASRVGDGLNF